MYQRMYDRQLHIGSYCEIRGNPEYYEDSSLGVGNGILRRILELIFFVVVREHPGDRGS